jgi:seryl-tRNA synthetase
MTTAAQEDFQSRLAAEHLLLPSRVKGISGQGPVFVELRKRLDRRIDALVADEGMTALEFPPLEPKHDMESVGYPTSFPHLLGAISVFEGTEPEALVLAEAAHRHEDWSGHLVGGDLVLVPAACHPIYPAVATMGPISPDGLSVDGGAAWVFRHEPSDEPTRLQAFHQRELVRFGSNDNVLDWRDRWREKALGLATALGLTAELDEANDPFFGRSGRMLARNQRQQALKFELLVPVGGEQPTAVASFNAHGDHFATTFGVTATDGSAVHTACLGFGLERWVLALLFTHGTDPTAWPSGVRAELAL